MNSQIQSWLNQGKVVEALCGKGEFFMPDVTYRDEHDFGLALSELVDWAKRGNLQASVRGLREALLQLLQTGDLRSALLLMRSYAILLRQNYNSLPLDENGLASQFGRAVREASDQLSRNEELRNLMLIVVEDFPFLKKAVGFTENNMQ